MERRKDGRTEEGRRVRGGRECIVRVSKIVAGDFGERRGGWIEDELLQ